MANDYDKIIKENIEELLPHLLRTVLQIDIPKLVPLRGKFQITLERELDDLKKVVHENPADDYILHIEVQTNDEDMRSRNLLYYGVAYHQIRLPIRQIVIYLGDRPARHILNNTLETAGIIYKFTVIDLRNYSKDLFLQSDKPEVIILAILADFGADQPAAVIRQILKHLLKVVKKVPRLRKYQKQLLVLSRLRKLADITLHEITNDMPIHYDIESDVLYLKGIEHGVEQGIEQGIEKGIEQGVEQGIEQAQTAAVTRMLRQERFTVNDIALIQGVTKAFVLKIARELQIEPINPEE